MVNTWIIVALFIFSFVAFLIFRNFSVDYRIGVALLILCASSCILLLMFDRFATPVYDSKERTEIGTYELSPFYIDGKEYYLEETNGELLFSYLEKLGDDEYIVEAPKVRYDPESISYNQNKPSVTIARVVRTSQNRWFFLEGPVVTENKVEYKFIVLDDEQIYRH